MTQLRRIARSISNKNVIKQYAAKCIFDMPNPREIGTRHITTDIINNVHLFKNKIISVM